MSRAGDNGKTPRAIIHKRILDVAESRPEATVEDIAGEVGSATADLVERVLEEYGDPAGGQGQASEQDPADEQPADAVDVDALSEKQRETLRLVHEHPDQSQAALADALDVSRATVSRRLNDIPGFDWSDRKAFTQAVLGDEPGTDTDESGPDAEAEDTTAAKSDGGKETTAGESGETKPDAAASDAATADGDGTHAAVERLDDRVEALEVRVEEVRADERAVSLPPELAHKVVHACMESDRVSEDEELQLLEVLLGERRHH